MKYQNTQELKMDVAFYIAFNPLCGIDPAIAKKARAILKANNIQRA